jgi:hypothetical protein
MQYIYFIFGIINLLIQELAIQFVVFQLPLPTFLRVYIPKDFDMKNFALALEDLE